MSPRALSRIVQVPRTVVLEDETEVEVLVEVEVDGCDSPAGWCKSIGVWLPPESRDARVVGVIEDAKLRVSHPEMLPWFENEPGVIADALEQDQADERDRYEDAKERRADMEREDRMLGLGRYER